MLFLAGVDAGDSVVEDDECCDVLGEGYVVGVTLLLLGGVLCGNWERKIKGKTYEANRGLSWLSTNVPRSVESGQSDLTVLIML